ncbi:MAG TPA: hypothetical protein VF443_14300 [Nitrospira sp.]
MASPEALREMILDYRKKIELYSSMVAEWERELGSPVVSNGDAASAGNTGLGAAATPGGDPVGLIRPYEFHGKSQTVATKIFLQRYGFPLSTDQLMAGLEKGGLILGGATAEKKKANFATILTRADGIVRAGRGHWNLGTKDKKSKGNKEKENAPPAANE